jgi:hypothetical protein
MEIAGEALAKTLAPIKPYSAAEGSSRSVR